MLYVDLDGQYDDKSDIEWYCKFCNAKNYKDGQTYCWRCRKDNRMVVKKKVNKFYVGAEHIGAAIASGTNSEWTKETEAAAIEHARTILENDENKEVVCVVKIVAIVERVKRPIKVRKV